MSCLKFKNSALFNLFTSVWPRVILQILFVVSKPFGLFGNFHILKVNFKPVAQCCDATFQDSFCHILTLNSSIHLYCLYCLVLIPNGETSNDLLPEGFLFRQVKTSLYKESAVHSAQKHFPNNLTLQRHL
jgi:hypothetical protein